MNSLTVSLSKAEQQQVYKLVEKLLILNGRRSEQSVVGTFAEEIIKRRYPLYAIQEGMDYLYGVEITAVKLSTILNAIAERIKRQAYSPETDPDFKPNPQEDKRVAEKIGLLKALHGKDWWNHFENEGAK